MAKKKDQTKKAAASKGPKVMIVHEPRLCGVCGERKTHRVVDGVHTCLICFEAPQAPEKPEE